MPVPRTGCPHPSPVTAGGAGPAVLAVELLGRVLAELSAVLINSDVEIGPVLSAVALDDDHAVAAGG